MHTLSKHVFIGIENNAISVIVKHPYKLLSFMIAFATHTEVVTSAIDHKGLENVVLCRGRRAERVKKRSDGGRRKRRIGVYKTDCENGWIVRDFLSRCIAWWVSYVECK